jgi:hypothetical protein
MLALVFYPDILAGTMTVNKLLEQQQGRCIWCGSLFEHCGGTEAHEVAIPCMICFRKMDGLLCEECTAKSKTGCG